jgi:hypothetical protein
MSAVVGHAQRVLLMFRTLPIVRVQASPGRRVAAGALPFGHSSAAGQRILTYGELATELHSCVQSGSGATHVSPFCADGRFIRPSSSHSHTYPGQRYMPTTGHCGAAGPPLDDVAPEEPEDEEEDGDAGSEEHAKRVRLRSVRCFMVLFGLFVIRGNRAFAVG